MAYSPQQSLRNAHGGGATAVHEVRPCSAAIMDKKMIYIYIYKSSQINASLIFERKFVKPIDWTLKQVTWMQGKVQTNAMGHVFFGDEKSAIDEQNCKSSLTVGGRAPGISFGQNSL